MALEQSKEVEEGTSKTGSAARLPRWTRQEILVLIQGKRMAETKARRIRSDGLGTSFEPKWASVSSYCRMHGVNRGPVQCRKRWSNLAADYKKIKDWESILKKDSSESFWSMRNDLRRERKLPGFFDKEVYDILDSNAAPPPPPELAGEEQEGPIFDSRRAGTAEDGMFSDFEQDDHSDAKQIPAAHPISGKEKQTTEEEQGQSGRKRKWFSRFEEEEEEGDFQSKLIDVLEKNGKVLSSHIDSHNNHLQHRINHSQTLISVLNKIADALVRISEKL